MHSHPSLLFPSLLGAAYGGLPEPIARLHRRGTSSYAGEVVVERGRGWLSRSCAAAARLPPAFAGPIRVDIEVDGARECWSLRVAGHVMRSRLWGRGGLLYERLGLLTFAFRLSVADERLVWNVARVRVLGLPLPARWFGAVSAVESVVEGQYRFDVRAALPLIGLLVHYRGWLAVEG